MSQTQPQHPQTATKTMPITAAIVTPVSDECEHTPAAAAASTVDAALNGVILHEKFEKAAKESTNRVDEPLIPTLTDCQFVPLRPAFSTDDAEAAETIRRFSEGQYSAMSEEEEDPQVLEAASILCMLSKATHTEQDVLMTMEAMQPGFHLEESSEGESVSDDDMYEEPIPRPVPTLRHPDRLSIPEDVEEVNRLHQYVRSDLLEIFVVPQNEDSDSEDEYHPKAQFERTTRGSTYQGTISNTTANRHYPGRVGFRCVHCANVRPVSQHATKSSFYPLRLHNIYREVCAWQRIHFKNCPYVPGSVRERYDWLKSSDTSRGKVRYWEVSAGKIGLENNPDREDGIVFSSLRWQM